MLLIMKLGMIAGAAAALYFLAPIVLGAIIAIPVLWLLLNSESAFWGGILGD